jgi:hypothetical protein
VLLTGFGCEPAAPKPIARETIEHQITALNSRTWRAAFDIEMNAEPRIIVHVAVRPVLASDSTRPGLEAAISRWEPEIERLWSGRLDVATESLRIPIDLDLHFNSLKPHHTVVVRRRGRRTDELNWGLDSPSEVVAHEIGHMLGAYDEYRGGGIDPETQLTDPKSIMSSGARGNLVYPRHLRLVLKWVESRLTLQGAEIVPAIRSAPATTP